MKKTNSGITHILAIVVVMVAVASLVAIFLSTQKGGLSSLYPSYPATTSTPSPEALPSPSPVSDSDDISTLEEEFNATVTGSVDADIDSMESEASQL